MDVLTLLYTVVFTVIGWVDGCPHTTVQYIVYNRLGGFARLHERQSHICYLCITVLDLCFIAV